MKRHHRAARAGQFHELIGAHVLALGAWRVVGSFVRLETALMQLQIAALQKIFIRDWLLALATIHPDVWKKNTNRSDGTFFGGAVGGRQRTSVPLDRVSLYRFVCLSSCRKKEVVKGEARGATQQRSHNALDPRHDANTTGRTLWQCRSTTGVEFCSQANIRHKKNTRWPPPQPARHTKVVVRLGLLGTRSRKQSLENRGGSPPCSISAPIAFD